MRIIRFQSQGKIYLGQPIDSTTAYQIEGDLFGTYRVTQNKLPIDKLLAPIIPTDILCIGLNYREHAHESGAPIPPHPVLFIKARSSLNNPFDPILIPRLSQTVDYECELAIIIGKTAKNISRDQAMDCVFGYTCANDVSARNWQREKDLGGGQWVRAKSFDTFCPLGPWIVTRDQIPNPNALRIRTLLNGNVMQDNNTADMIFDIPSLIQSLASTMTLHPGTVILTGTPQGVGFARTPPVYLQPGDTLTVEIESIGSLQNPVRAE